MGERGPRYLDQKVSRRDVLIGLGVGAAMAPGVVKGLEQAFYDSVIHGLTNANVNDKAVEMAVSVSEVAPNSENPSFRAIGEIVEEGILNYAAGHKNKPPFFHKIDGYQGVDYYAGIIKEFSRQGMIPQSPNKLVERLAGNLPEAAFEAFFQSRFAIDSYDQLFTKGSGFFERLRNRHPELIDSSGLYVGGNPNREQIMQKEAKAEVLTLTELIEAQREPVSSSFVLEHFLEENDGNIGTSMFDSAIYLKFMARNDLETAAYAPTSDKIDWYRRHIKDEYQGPSYRENHGFEEDINLIGKPYHSWNLAAMLQFLPVEFIRVGGLEKQLSTFSEQGLGKTRADLQTLEDLRDVEALLTQYTA